MVITFNPTTSLALLEKAAGYLRSAGHTVDVGIDAGTGEIRIFVDGTELISELEIDADNCPELDIPAEDTIH